MCETLDAVVYFTTKTSLKFEAQNRDKVYIYMNDFYYSFTFNFE